ncbi:methyl-accepting chemotaxis protein, partial [Burkholderia sp. SIMBA_013]
GNADLSSRTEEQAASLEETAASMEELATTVKQNADTAREANRMVAASAAVAQRGGEAVSSVVETMRAIQGSSSRISDIVGVID